MAAIIDETLLIKEIMPRFSCFLPVWMLGMKIKPWNKFEQKSWCRACTDDWL